jgi:uncharacterized membrane protein
MIINVFFFYIPNQKEVFNKKIKKIKGEGWKMQNLFQLLHLECTV